MEVARSDEGFLAWAGASSTGDGVIALVHACSNNGETEHLFVKLRPDGSLEKASSRLSFANVGIGGAVSCVSPSEAIAVLLYRTERESTNSTGLVTRFHYDRPCWLSLSCHGTTIKVEPMEVWNDMNLSVSSPVRCTTHGDDTFWTMTNVEYLDEPVRAVGRLAWGVSRGGTAPTPIKTEIRCGERSQAVLGDSEFYVLVNVGFEQLELWRIGFQGDSARLAVFKASGGGGEISTPSLVAQPGGCVAIWKDFNGRERRNERDAGIWFCPYTFADGRVGEPQRLTDDRNVAAGELRVAALAKSTVVMWENEEEHTGNAVRYINFETAAELPKKPQEFAEILPQEIVRTKGGALALSVRYSATPYYWSLYAEPLLI